MKTIAVIGIGYVGLGLAVALNKTYKVFGYDISKNRVEALNKNFDRNMSVSENDLAQCSIHFTSELAEIKEANFYIVTVSTPAYFFEMPNLEPLVNATKSLATLIKRGDIIVFESTSYPGTTEEVCLPLLEEISQLKCGVDFNIGYSPERVNPADKVHTFKNVPKIISAQNEQTLREIEAVYKSCCDILYPVSNIKTAEAVKILENTQRDVNIAFMNEFSEIMHTLDINTHETIEAAKTKWSFMPFKPGFVGGHCIAVDPHYLAFKAKRVGVSPDLILAARKTNDNITHFVVRELINIFIKEDINIHNSTVGIFGVTYKENTPDIRNSLSLKLVKEAAAAGLKCKVHDPLVDRKLMKDKYHLDLMEFDDMNHLSAIILTVGHDEYKELGLDSFLSKLNHKIFMDIPNLFIHPAKAQGGLIYWSL